MVTVFNEAAMLESYLERLCQATRAAVLAISRSSLY